MKGGKEYMMRAHFGLPSVESEEAEAKRPITVNFEIPYFTVSGIQVGPFTYIAQFGSVLLPCWFVVFFFTCVTVFDIYTWSHCRMGFLKILPKAQLNK